MEIDQRVLDTIRILREKPLLILERQPRFDELKCYIEGYLLALSQVFGADLFNRQFHWYRKKTGVNFDIVWTSYLEMQYVSMPDKDRKLVLLDTLEEFFLENPDWHRKIG